MSAGLNRYLPFSTVGQMGATPYLFRSGFNAGIAFCEDVRPEGYPRHLLQQGIAELHEHLPARSGDAEARHDHYAPGRGPGAAR